VGCRRQQRAGNRNRLKRTLFRFGLCTLCHGLRPQRLLQKSHRAGYCRSHGHSHVVMHGLTPPSDECPRKQYRVPTLNQPEMTALSVFCHARRTNQGESGTSMSSIHKRNPAGASEIVSAPVRQKFWPEGWWRIMGISIGIIPLPIYL